MLKKEVPISDKIKARIGIKMIVIHKVSLKLSILEDLNTIIGNSSYDRIGSMQQSRPADQITRYICPASSRGCATHGRRALRPMALARGLPIRHVRRQSRPDKRTRPYSCDEICRPCQAQIIKKPYINVRLCEKYGAHFFTFISKQLFN